ncbi:MAG: hypothetical protein KDL87_11480, partial [Verrucomicrobiae bacterium]|nr:hypothetical protein [Verrucomicrobiae bacterium]
MRHFVRSSCTGRLLALVAALVGFYGGTSAWAFNPGVTKLHGRSPETKTDFRFGQSVALSDLWLVVGEPQNDEIGDFAGAVQVFDARTGRFLRKITATDLPSFSFFGTSVSVCGNLALIGAPGANGGIGAAFVYDLKTGKRLAQLDPAFGVSGDDFGTAVSLGGDWALCGAPGFNGDKGVAYLFDVKTATQLARYQNPTPVVERFGSAVSLSGNLAAVGVPEHDTPLANAGAVFLFDASDRASQAPASLRKLSAADPVLNGAFGQSVSLYGHLLLTGAKGATGAAIGSGAAYLHDVRTGGELGKLFTVDGLFGQEFGSGVSLSGNLGLIGAQSGNGNSTGTGAAYLFDVSRRVELAKWIAPDGQGGDRYGVSVALCGGSALIGAHLDDDQANNSGAAYYYRNISGPLQLTSKAKSGDFAPGIIGADFVSFANVYLND